MLGMEMICVARKIFNPNYYFRKNCEYLIGLIYSSYKGAVFLLKCANELENIQMLFSNNDILHKCVVKYYENGDKNVSKLKSGV